MTEMALQCDGMVLQNKFFGANEHKDSFVEQHSTLFLCDRSFHAPMCGTQYLGTRVGIGMSEIARIQDGASFHIFKESIVTQNEMGTDMCATLSLVTRTDREKTGILKSVDYIPTTVFHR